MLGAETSTMVRRSIDVTVDRLQQASVTRNGPGHRYARMLELLWRRPADNASSHVSQFTPNSHGRPDGCAADQRTTSKRPAERRTDATTDLDSLNGFSWRDLSAVGNYIANVTSTTDFNGMTSGINHDFSGVDSNFINDWHDSSWLADDIVF